MTTEEKPKECQAWTAELARGAGQMRSCRLAPNHEEWHEALRPDGTIYRWTVSPSSRRSLAELIEASSLGTPEAKAARARVQKDVVDRVLARADELEAPTTAGRTRPDTPYVDPDAWQCDGCQATTGPFVRVGKVLTFGPLPGCARSPEDDRIHPDSSTAALCRVCLQKALATLIAAIADGKDQRNAP